VSLAGLSSGKVEVGLEAVLTRMRLPTLQKATVRLWTVSCLGRAVPG